VRFYRITDVLLHQEGPTLAFAGPLVVSDCKTGALDMNGSLSKQFGSFTVRVGSNVGALEGASDES